MKDNKNLYDKDGKPKKKKKTLYQYCCCCFACLTCPFACMWSIILFILALSTSGLGAKCFIDEVKDGSISDKIMDNVQSCISKSIDKPEPPDIFLGVLLAFTFCFVFTLPTIYGYSIYKVKRPDNKKSLYQYCCCCFACCGSPFCCMWMFIMFCLALIASGLGAKCFIDEIKDGNISDKIVDNIQKCLSKTIKKPDPPDIVLGVLAAITGTFLFITPTWQGRAIYNV